MATNQFAGQRAIAGRREMDTTPQEPGRWTQVSQVGAPDAAEASDLLLVYFTGKGDAMSGSGGVRTTFKGKASFEDTMSRATLFLGIGFMALMLIIDAIGNRIDWGASLPVAR